MGKEKKRTVTPVSCEVCGQKIGRRADLARHMKRHAPNKDIYMNYCTYPGCKYKTLQRSNLDTHLRTHTGERPKKCPVEGCDFATGDPASLTHHRMGIHGYNPKDDSIKETLGGRQKKTRTRFSYSPYSLQSSSGSDGSSSSSQSTSNTTPSPDRFDTPFVPDRKTTNSSSQDGVPAETSLAEAIKSGYAAFCTRLVTERQKANKSSQSSPDTQAASPPAAASQTVAQEPATVNCPLPALEQVDLDTARLLTRWFPLSVLENETTATLVNNFLESFNAPRTLSVPLDTTPPATQSSNNNENVPLNFETCGYTTGGVTTASAPLNTNVYGYPNGDTTVTHAPLNTDPYRSAVGNTTEVSASTFTNTYGYTVNGTSEGSIVVNPSIYEQPMGNIALAPASLNVGPYGNTANEPASTDANASYGYAAGDSSEQFVFTNTDAYGYTVCNTVAEHASNVAMTGELASTSTNVYGLGYATGNPGEQFFVDTSAHGHATGNTVTEHAPDVVNTTAELFPTSTGAYGYVAGGSGEQSAFVDTANAYGHAINNTILAPAIPLNANLYENIGNIADASVPASTDAYGYNVGGITQESAFADVDAGYPIGGTAITNTNAYEYAIGNTTANTYGQTATDAYTLPQVHAEQAYTFDSTTALPVPLHQAPALNTYGYAMNDMTSLPFSYNSLGYTLDNAPQASYAVNPNSVTFTPQFTGQEMGHYQTYPIIDQNSTYEAAPEASGSLAQGFYM